MLRKPTGAIIRASSLALLVATLGVGCGSDWDDDHHRYPGRDKTINIYLNISNADGEALQNATVWVDGTKQDEKTSDEFSRLGQQFPPDWRGWQYNWSGGPYFFDVYQCSGRTCRIEILVSKSGWQSQKTHITFGQWDPDEIYFRQTFVMERSTNTSAAPVDAPQPPEKTAL